MALAIYDLSLIVPDLDFSADDTETAYEKLDLDSTGLITYSQF